MRISNKNPAMRRYLRRLAISMTLYMAFLFIALRYVDSVTGDAVVSFNTLTAEGGVLVHTFGLSEGRAPLTFTGTCGPRENPRDLFNSLGITAKDRQR